MKALLGLLLCLPLVPMPVYAISAEVTLINAFVNQNRVMEIRVKGRAKWNNQSTTYLIGCNATEETCVMPESDVKYFLGDTNNRFYQCQNVALYLNGNQFGLYCLSGTE